jgi:hypothetical protein
MLKFYCYKQTKEFFFTLFYLSFSALSHGQNNVTEVKYRRSSLHTMVIESEKFPQKEVVLKAFNNTPFPDKYNDHTIGEKSFNPVNYTLTAEEKAAIYKPSKVGKLAANSADIKIDSVAKELPYRIKKYLSNEKIATKLVAKWFNRQEDGSFDWNLIAERGVFNASFLETKTAQASSDGIALLKTAGFELIENTFVVINKFKFYANEPVAAAVRDLAKIELEKKMAGKPQMMKDAAIKGIDAAYEKAKEGYSIFATSYLYKLVWNDSISNVFFTEMYMEKGSVESKKKEAFENTDLFRLEFIGDETANGLVTFSLKEKRSEEQIINLSTIRIIDNVYSKLQKKYDVFKTKTPLYTGYPITAKIGKKEGLEGGEKFEVFEQNMDPKTGKTLYKKVGKIKVDKKLVWDNRFGDNPVPVDSSAISNQQAAPAIDRTTFKGSKKLYSGLLIKQIK